MPIVCFRPKRQCSSGNLLPNIKKEKLSGLLNSEGNAAMFTAHLASQPQKFLKKCETQLYKRLRQHIEQLELNPFPSECVRVLGTEEKVFRIRVGDYRIQYTVFYEKNEILITCID